MPAANVFVCFIGDLVHPGNYLFSFCDLPNNEQNTTHKQKSYLLIFHQPFLWGGRIFLIAVAACSSNGCSGIAQPWIIFAVCTLSKIISIKCQSTIVVTGNRPKIVSYKNTIIWCVASFRIKYGYRRLRLEKSSARDWFVNKPRSGSEPFSKQILTQKLSFIVMKSLPVPICLFKISGVEVQR